MLVSLLATRRSMAPSRTAIQGSTTKLGTKSKFGTKAYWDAMYSGVGELPAETFSWYCSWAELQPFFEEVCPERPADLLVPGMGNDGLVRDLCDDGFEQITGFDYSADAVTRAEALLDGKHSGVTLLCADACELPLHDGAFDAVIDKGTLDAVDIAGGGRLQRAATELARVVRTGGVVVSVTRVCEPDVLEAAFPASAWERLRDGTLHIAPGGEASTDLAASLWAWRRKATMTPSS